MRFRVYCLSLLFLMSAPAYAQVAGEACPKFGETIVSKDGKTVLACLRATLGDPASPLVWLLNSTAPKAWQKDGGGDPFYTIGPERKAGQ